jgi:hypothetical protein
MVYMMIHMVLHDVHAHTMVQGYTPIPPVGVYHDTTDTTTS